MTINYFPTVRYWLDVESLAYPDLPKGKGVKTFTYGDRLPWQHASHQPVLQDHKYFVFFGLVERPVLEHELRALFQPPEASENFSGNQARPDKGSTFLCAVEVTAGGQVGTATLQLAAFAVAFAEKSTGGRIRYEDVSTAIKRFVENLQADGDGQPVSGAWFEKVIEFLIKELRWGPKTLMARQQMLVQRVSLVRKDGKPLRQPPELPPINSFYLEDLQRIVASAESGQASRQVERYINGDASNQEPVDVTDLRNATQFLHSQRFPAGRWPSEYPLFLMQQVAVNASSAVMRDGGLFSVNGPPGTGKTTLLMDVIAARIVDRARVLAGFEAPQQAFHKRPPFIVYPTSGQKAPVTGSSFQLDERLLDFGIVVASANNNAVENITADLPNLKKVHLPFLEHEGKQFDYFPRTAEAILRKEPAQSPEQADQGNDAGLELAPEIDEEQPGAAKCWGLVSVPLGRQANRNRVAYELGGQGEFGLAKSIAALDGEEFDWAVARAHFKRALEEVESLQADIARFDAERVRVAKMVAEQAAKADAESVARLAHETALKSERNAKAAEERCSGELSTNMAERTLLTSEWSWVRRVIGTLFRTREHAAFLQRRCDLENEYDRIRPALAAAKREHATHAATTSKLRVVHEQAAVEALSSGVALESCNLELARLRKKLGAAAFDPDAFGVLSIEQQQKSLPRSNEALHRARAKLFVSAMHLHKAFMKHAGKGFETNFRLALAMLERQSFLEPHLPVVAQDLWATFFLAVPVVSSTFASFSRCFKDLNEGQIGLLLIDEAGQAVPAHALGAIWRSKRALVVGDPLQVEPVIKMEPKLDVAILRHHGAPENQLLTRYSVQHLADRANRFGANVVQYDGEDLWVGSPLRVHRRCADPMFSLSNDIAYNRKMVFGPNPEDEENETATRPLLGPSHWIHLAADDFVEHFSQAEGLAVTDLVAEYKRAGWVAGKHLLPNLFVISPFKSVADGISNLLRDRTRDWAGIDDEEAIDAWLKAHVGTVHTFQGKESESVIFALGGRTNGARQWAAGRPNIINVAVTRAKRRLYVVGNRDAWESTPFGRKLHRAVARAPIA